MSESTVIPLKCWQDPQGDVLLVYSEHECSAFFGCWNESGEPADYICQLSFEHASLVRSFRREFLPYSIPKDSGHSYVLRVNASELLREHLEYRQKHYPEWSRFAVGHFHFVVNGHDIYHEILALDLVRHESLGLT